MFSRLEALERRLEVLDRMLSDPDVVGNAGRLREASREHAHVRAIVEAWTVLRDQESELAASRDMVHNEEDAELREMAREEVSRLEAAVDQSLKDLRLAMLPKDPYEGRPILLEIRAGTGGDEAALFAADLFRMYTRFAERTGLRVSMISSNTIATTGSSQGFKEVIASVTGDRAYTMLRFEGGVHRVQRIPVTESQGRIHTSAATVAILPEPEEVEIKIDAKDLRIDTMRAGGPGGQSVNTTDSAVRIVHIPTGLTVQCQDEKSQLKNKDKAMRVLSARLLAMEMEARHSAQAAERLGQVGSGDRSERIRTYNFPQNRLTDHRIGLTLYKLDRVMEGDLQELADALTAAWQAEQLARQESTPG
jgi:peptide chain release factor 1